MSVYNAIGNTYVELLDYITVKYKAYNNNFDEYFKRMNDMEKQQLVEKIGEVYKRVDIIKNSQKLYFGSKIRNSLFFLIIMIISIIVTFCIFGFLFLTQIKGMKEDTDIMKKVQVFVMYAFMFMFMFTVFLVLALNVKFNEDMYRKMRTEVYDNISKFSKVFVIESPLVDKTTSNKNKPVEITELFRFAAYKSSETYSSYNSIYRQNTSLLQGYITQDELNKGLKSTCTFSYTSVFNDHKSAIKDTISSFYANGQGYTTIRKKLVEFSNPQLIKEIRTILKYYYSVIIRKQNAEQMENIDDSKTQIIENTVVDQMKVLLNLKTASNLITNAYTTSDGKSLEELATIRKTHEDDPNFAVYYNRLKKLYAYTIVYCTPAWLRAIPDDAFKVAYPEAYAHLPQFLDVKKFASNEQVFAQEIKDVFTAHYETHMKAYLESIKTSAPQNTTLISTTPASDTFTLPTTPTDAVFASICTKVFNDLRDIYEKYYSSTMMRVTSPYYFPYDMKYIVAHLIEFQAVAFGGANSIVSLPAFLQDFAYAAKRTIASEETITLYKQSANYQSQQNAIVQRLTPVVEKMNIKLVDYSNFIISKVNENVATHSPEIDSVLKQIILMIDANIVQKGNMNTKTLGQKSSDMRFLDADQFISKINELSFNDFKTGLNIEWFKDVTGIFYSSISSSTNSDSLNSKDIYVQEKKRQKISKTIFIMLTITFILVLIYHIMNVYDEFKSMENISNAKDSEKKWALIDGKVNTVFKGIIPIVALVFFICLFWSILKKSDAKFHFNRETIDSNTSKFKKSVFDLHNIMDDISNKVRPGETTKLIKDLKQITFEDKTLIYENIKIIIDKSEKCNYILAVQSGDMPFPYSEIVIDAFMALVCILCILFIVSKINPIEKMRDIKTLYIMKERGMYLDGDTTFINEVKTKAKCHDTDIESIVFTVKILFFLFIIAFLIFYAGKVVESTSEYQGGLYNSYYYEESLCVM